MEELFDQAAALGGITVIEAPSGSGKSCGTDGWYKTHPGEVYRVTLSGITNRTNLMQKIGMELGFATCQRKASELQAKIEAFFQRTRAMLICDEAHWLWPQRKRISSNPELIDWIDSLVNVGARIVLICTDQFGRQRDRVERQTAWTSARFKRRVRENRKLDGSASLNDVKLVANHLIRFTCDPKTEKWALDPAATRRVEVLDVLTDAVAGVAVATDLPLSAVDNMVAKARYHARRSGRSDIALADIEFARKSCEASNLTHLASASAPSTSRPQSLPTNPALRRARASELAGA